MSDFSWTYNTFTSTSLWFIQVNISNLWLIQTGNLQSFHSLLFCGFASSLYLSTWVSSWCPDVEEDLQTMNTIYIKLALVLSNDDSLGATYQTLFPVFSRRMHHWRPVAFTFHCFVWIRLGTNFLGSVTLVEILCMFHGTELIWWKESSVVWCQCCSNSVHVDSSWMHTGDSRSVTLQ